VLPSPHTAERIEELVRDTLLEWQIPEQRISAILTDNGSNMIAAFKAWVTELRAKDGERDDEDVTDSLLMTQEGPEADIESEQDEGMDVSPGSASDEAARDMEEFEQQELEHDVAFCLRKRLSCFNHTLQLVVRKFDTVQSQMRALQAAHRLVKRFSKSVRANEKLISLCGLKLISDSPTRRNSTLLLISQFGHFSLKFFKNLNGMIYQTVIGKPWRTTMMC